MQKRISMNKPLKFEAKLTETVFTFLFSSTGISNSENLELSVCTCLGYTGVVAVGKYVISLVQKKWVNKICRLKKIDTSEF